LETHRLHPDQLLRPGLWFGLLMILLGVLIAGIWRGDDLPRSWYPTDTNIPAEIALGLAAGTGSAILVGILTQTLPMLRGLLDKILAIIQLENVTLWHALAFGLLAGIPEEILFRGGLQPTLGLILTALLFGLVHAITPLYILYAALAGLGLGGLAEWRGDLWAATAAHFAYDAGLFMVIRWQLQRRELSAPENV
jgi:hypothetical protein